MKIREFIDEIQVLETKAEFASKFSYLLREMMHTTKAGNPEKFNRLFNESATALAEYRDLINDDSDDE